jgi:hypothetical protein
MGAQCSQQAALVFHFWIYFLIGLHAHVMQQADDMEAVSHNFGIGKVSADEMPVSAAEIDTDNFDPVPALKIFQIARKVTGRTSLHNVEYPVLPEVTESGGIALPFTEEMFVNPKDSGTLSSLDFFLREHTPLVIPAFNGCLAHPEQSGKGLL